MKVYCYSFFYFVKMLVGDVWISNKCAVIKPRNIRLYERESQKLSIICFLVQFETELCASLLYINFVRCSWTSNVGNRRSVEVKEVRSTVGFRRWWTRDHYWTWVFWRFPMKYNARFYNANILIFCRIQIVRPMTPWTMIGNTNS